ncbi:hypothetical protein C8Q76DRAFT_601459, partial [Earliella scabrosa]
PDWVKDAVDYFEVLDFGGQGWVELVDAWQRFEMHMGYPDSRKEQNRLPPGLRPVEVAAWMKDGRDYEKLPEVDPDDFPTRWKAWWVSLQPPCRTAGSSWPPARAIPEDNGEWGLLWRGGQCGLFLAVISVAWW